MGGMEKTWITYTAKVSASASGRKGWERAVRREHGRGKRERRPVTEAANFKGKNGQKSLIIWVLFQVQLSMKIKNYGCKPQTGVLMESLHILPINCWSLPIRQPSRKSSYGDICVFNPHTRPALIMS